MRFFLINSYFKIALKVLSILVEVVSKQVRGVVKKRIFYVQAKHKGGGEEVSHLGPDRKQK